MPRLWPLFWITPENEETRRGRALCSPKEKDGVEDEGGSGD